MIGLGAITIAERKYAQHGAPVYMYIFTHASDMLIPGTQHKLGAAHALEIPYKFNLIQPLNHVQNSDPKRPGPDIMAISDPDSVKAAHNMSGMWATFARTGHPGVEGQPVWPAYDLKKRATMEIDAHCKVVDDPFGMERAMWEKLEP
jgi:para-nitrobenzyl esterase